MSDQMPTGWMSADEARKWARRGVWAHGPPENTGSDWVRVCTCGDDLRRLIIDDSGHHYRLIGPHPDDEPAAETVEIEAWVAVWTEDDGKTRSIASGNAGEYDGWLSDMRAAGTPAKVVHLTGYTTPPTPEAVETVRGVSRE